MPQTECKGHGEPNGQHGGPGPDLCSFKTAAVSQTLYLGLGDDMDSTRTPQNFPKTSPGSLVNQDYHAVTPDLSPGALVCKNNL